MVPYSSQPILFFFSHLLLIGEVLDLGTALGQSSLKFITDFLEAHTFSSVLQIEEEVLTSLTLLNLLPFTLDPSPLTLPLEECRLVLHATLCCLIVLTIPFRLRDGSFQFGQSPFSRHFFFSIPISLSS